MKNSEQIKLEQLFEYFKKLPHQIKAIQELEQDILKSGYTIALNKNRPWFKTWSQESTFKPSSSFDLKITPNISYGEFSLNQEERRFNEQHQCNTAKTLAEFLEKVRSHFNGNSVIITSGYRPSHINRAVGGASNSEHLYNTPDTGAVDFYVANTDIYEVQKYCDKFWPYSVGYGAPKGFVHLGIRAGKPEVRWDY